MRLRRALAASAFALLVSPAAALAQDEPVIEPPRIEPEDQIVLAGSVVVPRGERVGEVVIFSGRATVHGVATGDVVVLEGPVTVTGQVHGSVIAADGVVRLAESARVGGDVFSSEEVLARPGAKVGGDARSDVRFSFEGPLAALGKLLGPVAISVSVLLMGLVLLLLVPRGADAVAETLTDAPLVSLGWGILIAIAVPVAAVALLISVLGLPLGLALLFSSGLWWLTGLTWAAWCAGRGLVRPPRGRATAFLAGWAILAAVGLVPILNVAVWTLAPAVGLGAMLVAAWRSRHGPRTRGRHRSGSRVPPDDAIQAGIA
ncbi:MAG TPA: polymer-forming cytoskeletal protein [Actinomycetota bacterium]|nr:polymer-forming cytoskeletal protein [Actinomycetota bacterium]